MRLLRSLLFVPGNNLRMILKASTTAADAVILDLEDAVAPADKPTARVVARDALGALKASGITTLVRVNALQTGLTEEDLDAVVQAGLDAVMLPKAEDRSDVVRIDDLLLGFEEKRGLPPGGIAVLPIIESALGVVSAVEIARGSSRVLGLAFGAGDFCRDMRRNPAFISDDQHELLYARSQIAVGAVAAGLIALDTVFFGQLSDKEGFERESRHALALGYSGKSVIHPSQIDLANRIFLPSQQEVDYARGLVNAFEKAEAAGAAAATYEGRMIDIMSVRQARDLLSLVADAELTRSGGREAPPLSSFFRCSRAQP